MVERACFAVCLALGRLLRSVKYARVWTGAGDAGPAGDDAPVVRKRRAPLAPLLIAVTRPLVALLDAGVRFLPQGAWEERERAVYRLLHRREIQVDPEGVLVLPRLPGVTLAALLGDPALDDQARQRAMAAAAASLRALHRLGLTHADAMADNVLVDLEKGAAHWFDFETVHEETRPEDWRRADDLRALLASCLARTVHEELQATLRLVLDTYADEAVARLLRPSFASACRRPLAYHLSQAPLSFPHFQEIRRLLGERHVR
jgi:hypothetical protein